MRNEPGAIPSTGWLQVGERAPTDLVDARFQLHWAVQLVSAVGTTLLPAAADDSHTNLEWLPEPGLLAGRLTADARRCRAALRVTDLRLYVLNEDGAASAQHALDGMTLDQGLVWLEQEIAAFWQHPLPKPLRRPQLDLPDHAVGRGAVFRVPGKFMTINEVADELSGRLTRLFLADSSGRRPVLQQHEKLATDPHFRDYVLFHEYFDGDSGRGVGASHQTGWTGLVAKLLQPRKAAQ
jgi:hypothetical protein